MEGEAVSTIPIEWIYAMGSGLVVAIGWLARQLFARQSKTEEKLEACEERHEATNAVVLELTGRVGHLEGKQEGVEGLAKQVLDVVDRNTRTDAGSG